jgi:hypothetical protein
MLRYRTQGFLAAGLGLLFAGCFSDPDLKTGLRPEGPPEVLSVLALDLNTGHEGATFCKYDAAGTLDEKGPGLVQGSTICPKLETDFAPEAAEPLGWGVRLVFDELLNGDQVETLDCDVTGAPDGGPDGIQDNPITTCDGHIATTQPVTVTCEGVTGAVGYDGYYVPNGNKDSFPVGPSIAVFPDNVAPTGSTCTVVINPVVVDKTDVTVLDTDDTFTVDIAELTLVDTDPVDAEAVADRAVLEPDGAVAFIFNSYMDEASIAVSEITLSTEAGVAVAATFEVLPIPDDYVVIVYADAPLAPGNYTAKITTGATLGEYNGGTTTFATEVAVRFVVAAP